VLNAEQKMCRAVQLGFERMKFAREARYRLLAQYVGPLYAKDKMGGKAEEKKAAPINLMYTGVTTLVPNLVYNDPQGVVGSEYLPYRAYAESLGLASNQAVKKMKLRKTLRMAVTDAIFSAGVIKTGIAVGDQTIDLDNKPCGIGEIYADRVDFDDYVFDPMARSKEEMAWEGNRFRIRKELLLDSGQYDNAEIEKLCNRYKEGNYREEASNLFGDGKVAQKYQELEEYVDLVEVYLPREGAIVTVPYGEYGCDKILRTVEYQGPEEGPYHLLGFAWVPDNVLPVPPASLWYYLHVMGNRVARKITTQAERSKRVLAYKPSAFEDARQIVDADDGATIECEDPDGVKELNYGGTTDEMYEYMGWVEQQFSKLAGNLDLLAGQKSGAPTATEAEMLQSNAGIRTADMQEAVYQFTAEIFRSIAFEIHTDPLYDTTLCKRDQRTGTELQVRYTPEMREGNFLDYAFTVKPYSMARQDPNLQLKRLMEFIGTGIPALAQAVQLLGPAFKIENALAVIGRKMGIDELDELIDSPLLLQMLMQKLQGAPAPDGKAPGSPGAGVPTGKPGQPNPTATQPIGGIMPSTERKMQQQETAGELQATY
jgi:hypothetical protein